MATFALLHLFCRACVSEKKFTYLARCNFEMHELLLMILAEIVLTK